MEKVIRQGDMIFNKIDKSVVANKKKVTKSTTLTVGVGETSGHKHLVMPVGNTTILEYGQDSDVLTEEDLFVDREEIFFEVIGGNAIVRHEEHDAIILEPGVYKRWNQVSYNPFEKKLQKVRD